MSNKDEILNKLTVGMFAALADETPDPYVTEVDASYNDVKGDTPEGETAEGDINRKTAEELARKARRYVESPSDAPEGVNIEEGPQGGYYYETGENGSEGDDESDDESSDWNQAKLYTMGAKLNSQFGPKITNAFLRNAGEVLAGIDPSMVATVLAAINSEDEPEFDVGLKAKIEGEMMAKFLAQKARRYVDDPSEVPEGIEVHEGEQGGLYYETEGEDEDEELGEGDSAYFDATLNVAGQEIDISDTPVEIVEFNQEYGAVIINHPKYGNEVIQEEDIDDIEPASEEAIVETPEEEGTDEEEEEGAFREELPPDGDIVDSEPLDIQTAEEASDYLQNNISDDIRNVEELHDSVAVDMANSIKRQVEDIGVSPPGAIVNRYLDGAEACIHSGDLYVSTNGTSEEYEEEKRFMYSDGTRMHQGDTVERLITHEMGHVLESQIIKSRNLKERRTDLFGVGEAFQDNNVRADADSVSTYAPSKPGEYFAEAWTAYIHEDHDVLSDDVISFFDDVRDYLQDES